MNVPAESSSYTVSNLKTALLETLKTIVVCVFAL